MIEIRWRPKTRAEWVSMIAWSIAGVVMGLGVGWIISLVVS